MPTASLAIIEDNDKIRNYLLQLIVNAFPETEVTAYPNAEEAFDILAMMMIIKNYGWQICF